MDDEIAAYLVGELDGSYERGNRKSLPVYGAGRFWKLRKEEVASWLRSGRGKTGTAEARRSPPQGPKA